MSRPCHVPDEMHDSLNARYAEFDAILAFVKKAKLPTCKCSIRASTVDGHDPVSRGYSHAAEHVAAAICLALEETASDGPPAGPVTLTAHSDGPTVFVHSDGYCLLSFTRLTPAEVQEAKEEWVSWAILSQKDRSAANQVRLRALLSKRDPFEEMLIHPYMPGGMWNRPEE